MSNRFNGAALEHCKNCKNKQHVLWEHIMSYRFNGAAREPCKNCKSSKQHVLWKHSMSNRFNGAALEPCKTEKTSNMFCGSALCLIGSMGQPFEPFNNCKSSQQHVRLKHIMCHRFNGAALEPCISGASYLMRTWWVCYVAVSDLIGYGLCRQTFSPAPLGFPRKLVKPIPSGPVSVP